MYTLCYLVTISDLPGEPPPPPPDVAQNDLMMRLGLLLGDRVQSPSPSPANTQQSANQTEERFHSPPSVTSDCVLLDKSLADISPISTLTVGES